MTSTTTRVVPHEQIIIVRTALWMEKIGCKVRCFKTEKDIDIILQEGSIVKNVQTEGLKKSGHG